MSEFTNDAVMKPYVGTIVPASQVGNTARAYVNVR